MKEVVIVQNTIPHFRVDFFDKLRENLEKSGIRLRLFYSKPDFTTTHGEDFNDLFMELPWAEKLPSWRFPGNLRWQPVAGRCKDTDLLIVTHATSGILIWGWYLLPFWRRPKVAFWGHGWNHQSDNPETLSERLKTWLGKRARWYFAYTWHVRQELIKRGYDAARITDVQNAIHGPEDAARPQDVEDLRRDLGLDDKAWVALYCGHIYRLKQMDMLIEAARRVHERLPSFALVIAGAGPEQKKAEKAAAEHSFIHFVGPILDARKAAYFALSRAYVLPGLVGLGVVDAFHHGVPPVATKFPYHSPEFVYLEHGRNGLVADNTAESLAAAIVELATDDELYQRVLKGVETASRTYTVDAMAERFAQGIIAALRVESEGSNMIGLRTEVPPPSRAK